jgi:hypothetical protein
VHFSLQWILAVSKAAHFNSFASDRLLFFVLANPHTKKGTDSLLQDKKNYQNTGGLVVICMHK